MNGKNSNPNPGRDSWDNNCGRNGKKAHKLDPNRHQATIDDLLQQIDALDHTVKGRKELKRKLEKKIRDLRSQPKGEEHTIKGKRQNSRRFW